MIEILGLIGAVILPLWNIPLIMKIARRDSSKDFSLTWAWGVWGCLIAMLPAALVSPELVFKVFSVLNLAFFTAVVVQILRYR